MVPFSQMVLTDTDDEGKTPTSAFWDIVKSQDSAVMNFRKNHVIRPRVNQHGYDVGAVPNISPQDAILEKENATNCKVCQKLFIRKQDKVLDHDHHDGRYRGILCHPCNKELGYLEKFIRQPLYLTQLLNYLNS